MTELRYRLIWAWSYVCYRAFLAWPVRWWPSLWLLERAGTYAYGNGFANWRAWMETRHD